jgi:hypothetical protein
LVFWFVNHYGRRCDRVVGQSGLPNGHLFIFSFPIADTDLYPLAKSPVKGQGRPRKDHEGPEVE